MHISLGVPRGLALLVVCLDLRASNRRWVSTLNNVFRQLDVAHGCTCSMAVVSVQTQLELEFLALNVEITKDLCITVVGCYRPPSALNDALQSLMDLLSRLNFSEIVLAGDLNWDWLKPGSDNLKSFCDSVNLTQLINLPTCPNLKCPEKSTIIDLILTNIPHKYSAVGVFCNDLSDHCLVVAVRNTKVPKSKLHIICTRILKHFNIDMPPLRRYRVKGRNNPWFSTELADSIHERNLAWAKARTTGSTADWLIFRQLCNKCSFFNKKAKPEYYLSVTTDNLNDPRKFWKTIKSLSVRKDSQALPTFIRKYLVAVHDKLEILNFINKYFISSGSLFDAVGSVPVKPCSNFPVYAGQSSNFVPFSVQALHKALKTLDPRKPPGLDFIDPNFFETSS